MHPMHTRYNIKYICTQNTRTPRTRTRRRRHIDAKTYSGLKYCLWVARAVRTAFGPPTIWTSVVSRWRETHRTQPAGAHANLIGKFIATTSPAERGQEECAGSRSSSSSRDAHHPSKVFSFIYNEHNFWWISVRLETIHIHTHT